MTALRIIIPGAPRTKKTSNRIIKLGSFHKVMPSEAYMAWFKEAMRRVSEIQDWAHSEGINLPITGPVWVKASFYLENAKQGDLCGYLQGIGDWLQERRFNANMKPPRMTRDGAGIITDDKQVVSWDGSRVFIDRLNPRTEIEVRAYQEHLKLLGE